MAAVAPCTSPTRRGGIFGANGIVAAGLPIATGAATAAQLRGERPGRGGLLRRRCRGPGCVPRGAQPRRGLAAAGHLLLREQRLLGVLARLGPTCGEPRATCRGLCHSLPRRRRQRRGGHCVDDAGRRQAARSGAGPSIVEAATYRWHGHYEGDPQRYRSEDEIREWQARDPLVRHRERLVDAGVPTSDVDTLESGVAAELDRAVEAARALPAPSPSSLFDFVVRPTSGRA